MSPRVQGMRHARQYTAPPELARQLQERDREIAAIDQQILDLFGTGKVITPESYYSAAPDVTAALNYAIKAAQQVGGIVALKAGVEYVITATLHITAPVSIVGQRSVIRTIGSNVHMLRISPAASDVLIDGVIFRGNNTGTGGSTYGVAGGDGIAIHQATRVTIRNCRFEKLGVLNPVHGQFASPIHALGVGQVSVLDCEFSESCWNRTGADCLLGGSDLYVTGCRSTSHCDAFVSLGDTGDDIRHIITGNFARRDGTILNRSGILASYGSSVPSYSDISHNQIEGFAWHGIYAAGDETGGLNITANFIRYCGGADADGGTAWPGAGIKVSGTNGAIIQGNNIHGSGYTPEGVARDTVASGILAYGVTTSQNIVGNSISGSSAAAIRLDAAGGGALEGLIENMVVEANNIFENDGDGIEVVAQVTTTECVRNVAIRGNSIRISAEGGRGVYCHANNGGWYNQVQVIGNTILHIDPPSSGFVGGVEMAGYSDFTRYGGSVCMNSIIGFRRGVRLIGVTAHLFCPFALLVDGNQISASFDAVALDGGSGVWGLHSNTFADITTGGRTRPGYSLGLASTASRPRVRFTTNLGAPGDGAWVVGDRIDIESPAAGVIGLYCSVAGTPGTWSNLTA